MGDWKLLGSILEEVHIHSTIVGKIWLTILFIFRMLVLAVAAEEVWEDEQSQFVCNTDQPGCKAVCYDVAFPISLVRFWMLQVVFVSAPSLFYMGHTLYRIRYLEKGRHRRRVRIREEMGEMGETDAAPEEHRRMERELRRLHERRRVKRVPLRGSLLRTYILHILTRSVVEVCFILGQWVLYGVRLDPLYRCSRPPCPNTVDCYVSRPTEKTIFMVFMVGIAGVSLFLNVVEITHLGARKIRQTLNGERFSDDDSLISEPVNKPFAQHLCVMSHVSRHSVPRDVPKVTLEVNPRPLRHNAEVKPERETSSRNSSARSTPRESPQRNTPGQTPAAIEGPPQRRESQELGGGEAEQHVPSACRAAPSDGKGDPKDRAPPPRGDPQCGNHLQPPEALLVSSSCSTAVHRPSAVAREEVSAWRDSLGSGVLFPPNPRKSSYMAARPPSDSASNVSGSSDSVHSSEESDELGSLHGDTPMMAPPGGRRMSMSVFLDISSIMKK